MSNVVTQLAKIIKNKLVRTVNGGGPDSNGNVDLPYMARKDKENTFSGTQTISGRLHVVSDSTGVVLSGNSGTGVKTLLSQFAASDAFGDGLVLSASGLTIVGGGEAGTTFMQALQDGTLPRAFKNITNPGIESTIIGADGEVYLVSAMNGDVSTANTWRLSAGGDLQRYANTGWQNVAMLNDVISIKPNLANGDDLDNVVSQGYYSIIGLTSLLNFPLTIPARGQWAWLKVLSIGGFITQELTTSDGKRLLRTRSGDQSVWSQWSRITMDATA